MKIVLYVVLLFTLFKICVSYSNFTGIEICSSYINYPSEYGSYGEMGIPSPTNFPGGRIHSHSVYNKTTNILWIFGGHGRGETVGGKKWKNFVTV